MTLTSSLLSLTFSVYNKQQTSNSDKIFNNKYIDHGASYIQRRSPDYIHHPSPPYSMTSFMCGPLVFCDIQLISFFLAAAAGSIHSRQIQLQQIRMPSPSVPLTPSESLVTGKYGHWTENSACIVLEHNVHVNGFLDHVTKPSKAIEDS
jgi:hypothetical protein